ncbi:MAG: lysophospholipid acyltransferase family protein [Bacteroidales bacterium]|jgi:KDO2-lipid IV(A) lauroyltransferase|nr:lysophospholipid acyltransferase family protein [Bacteroidales bacterium]
MVYKVVFIFLKLLSRLPFWCLHRISDVLYLLLYYIIRYRRKVIFSNLAIVFPDHSILENAIIAKKFVRHFSDFLVESLKTLSISEKELKERYIYLNHELIQKQIENGKSIMLVTGHNGNWEWLFYYGQVTNVLSWAAYTPLSNPVFDKLMVINRERYGFKVVPSKKAANKFAQLNSEKMQFVNCLMSDQSPSANYKYRATFLGKDVPFFIGPEAYSKKYDLPVFYGSIRKVARSKYAAEFIPISMNPKEEDEGWITSEYIRLLELDIHREPENYLWSHRRFKHAKTS